MKHCLPRTIACLLVAAGLAGCNRYLDIKGDSNLLTPSNAEDLFLLLNNELLNLSPLALHTGTDEFYFTGSDWENADSFIRQAYIWHPYAHQPIQGAEDWNVLYTSVQYANTVLQELDGMNDINSGQYRRIKGTALFFRSFMFYQLLQVYAPAFEPISALNAGGIALRLTADINELSVRSTLRDSYQQAGQDLKEALALLPSSPSGDNLPSAAAAAALLARLFLTTGNYPAAEGYATKALSLKGTLADFNSFQSLIDYKTRMMEDEMIFYSVASRNTAGLINRAYIDTLLVDSYADTDLRRSFYFTPQPKGRYRYQGSCVPTGLFNGITTGEVYLIRAEALARQGRTTEALKDLNLLLSKRYDRNHFVPDTVKESRKTLALILKERKKELLFHGTRWSDIKRLNLDPFYRHTLKRYLLGKTYLLPPGDQRFAYLLPPEVIRLTRMPQNER